MITNFSLCSRGMFSYEIYVGHGGSVGRALDWGLKLERQGLGVPVLCP